jgi:hypothetical protein
MNGANHGEPKFKNGFFRSNLFIFLMGQVVTVLVGLVFFAVGWGRLSQQFQESMEWRATTQARLERMDKEGTNASKYSIQTEQGQIMSVNDRLKYIEEQVRKLDVMQLKIDRLESDKADKVKK